MVPRRRGLEFSYTSGAARPNREGRTVSGIRVTTRQVRDLPPERRELALGSAVTNPPAQPGGDTCSPIPSDSDSRLCPSGCILSCAWRLTSEVSTVDTLPHLSNVYCLPRRARAPPGGARYEGRVRRLRSAAVGYMLGSKAQHVQFGRLAAVDPDQGRLIAD